MVRLTDHLDMTLAVYRRGTTTTTLSQEGQSSLTGKNLLLEYRAPIKRVLLCREAKQKSQKLFPFVKNGSNVGPTKDRKGMKQTFICHFCYKKVHLRTFAKTMIKFSACIP